ncbi:MAG: enoyl-CoA hydratase-related protein [Candidatus Palauibacterales bacterium]|nr:enoyl-CoA hydratase-related protein [Candidatus Palauibacterales bacterium]MDP2529010.1 enoyl-CoA hydratase-related protein [Candidatus Palauibacterales bacterium]MDP2583829.1 enoyl-CoA hydratase-related protein [Candidatus Palauibacterales bacterium]
MSPGEVGSAPAKERPAGEAQPPGPIRVEHRGAVGVITIHRPERFNSLDVETARDLRKAGLQMARDEEVRCVVLRGTNGVFCSGADLKYVRQRGEERDFGYLQPDGHGPASGYGESFKEILEYLHSTISEIKRAPKPFVAAVDGVAAAGGFGLAMSCDLVFASERSTFEWAYPKTGLTGAESSTFFLPRLVGLRKALELVLLNPRLDAREALEAGLLTDVFPDAEFEARVDGVAERLAAGPTRAYAVAKALIHQADGVDRLDYHLDRELEELARIADEPNFAEGLAAFFEKRDARFEGR